MGAKVSAGQQEDLGILAVAALRYILNKPSQNADVMICGAVAHVVPLLAESDIRQLMWEVDGALTNSKRDQHEWTELMMVLRRVDRP